MSLPAEPEDGAGVTDGGAGATSRPCLASGSVPADTTWACPTCGHPLWSADQGESGAAEPLRSGVDLPTVLAAHQHIVDDAVDALPLLQLPHYERLDTEAFRERVRVLYELILECLAQGTLEPISRHGEVIAEERLTSGFDLGEVQTAFNLLEEAVWRVAISHLPADHHAAARSGIGRVLAAGKDGLARGWVATTAGNKTAQSDELLATLVASMASMHPTVPRKQLEEMADEALAKTENARIKGHRLPLAHHDVTERAAQWERAHHTR
jgi:hypothetical protein